jgi:hypothetical protein
MIVSSACVRLLGRSFAITISASSESSSLHVVDLDPAVVGQCDPTVSGVSLLLIIIIVIIITAIVWTDRVL